VFEPGEVIYGIGQLPPLSGADLKHHNIAVVSAIGYFTGKSVTASDELIIDPADLAITKFVISGESQFVAGGNVVWEITVTNNGPSRAVNIDVEDHLDSPTQATIKAAKIITAPIGRSATIGVSETGPVAWIEYLDVDELLVLRVSGTLASDLRHGTVVSNSAIVISDTADPNLVNNTATATLIVMGVPVVERPELTDSGVGLAGAVVTAVALTSGGVLSQTNRFRRKLRRG
jgi:uncharacterized repeat protein (TIGR01451 family)